MRIAILTEHHCKDAFGGAEYRVSLMARNLAELDHSVYYVCTSPDATEWSAGSVRVIPIKAKRFSRRFGKNYFLYRSDIFKAMDRIQPDVIYQTVASAFTGLAASYAKKNHCRMVWHIAHEREVRPKRFASLHTALFDYIDRRWAEYGIRSSDAIIGQARYQDRLLAENYARRCDLVVGTPHPVPSEPLVKTEPITVVWAANLKPWKQPTVFLDLVRILDEYSSVRFIMIGRPTFRSYQRRLKREMEGLKNFTYLGGQAIETVNRILAQSHVFVNTSQHEGFPNTFVQAWSRRVPVVSLHVDPDGVLKTQGLGFHSVSFEGLVRDVKRLIEDRALRESIGERAHAYALRHHSMAPNIAKIASLLAGANQADVLTVAGPLIRNAGLHRSKAARTLSCTPEMPTADGVKS